MTEGLDTSLEVTELKSSPLVEDAEDALIDHGDSD